MAYKFGKIRQVLKRAKKQAKIATAMKLEGSD